MVDDDVAGGEALHELGVLGPDETGADRHGGEAAFALDKARAATAGVVSGDFALVQLDLADLASVRACADALVARGEPFDLVIANAGVMATPQGKTVDGYETQFGTNHLGHFVLVNRMATLLRDGSRLVTLSSAGHRFADVDLDDPGFENTPYDPWVAYGRSKTANALFAVEFDRRHRDRGIRAAAVHPGGIQTDLGRHMTDETAAALQAAIAAELQSGQAALEYKSVPQGAATSVWAGVVAAAAEVGGRYCEDCHVADVIEGESLSGGVRRYAIDPRHAEALWTKSEELVGECF
ncbi:MAG: SDR family NAD(P)-dependent oxidoreductase [Polyangiaceae bacterium]|nr:SDR family NAD(P)-dependent oxidoreductase [Polyangiaceae bacterium]